MSKLIRWKRDNQRNIDARKMRNQARVACDRTRKGKIKKMKISKNMKKIERNKHNEKWVMCGVNHHQEKSKCWYWNINEWKQMWRVTMEKIKRNRVAIFIEESDRVNSDGETSRKKVHYHLYKRNKEIENNYNLIELL